VPRLPLADALGVFVDGGVSGEAGMETHAAWSEVSGESRRAVGKASRRNETVFMSGGGTDGVVD